MNEIDFDSPEVVRILAVANELYRMNGQIPSAKAVSKHALARLRLTCTVLDQWMNSMGDLAEAPTLPSIFGVRFPKELYEN